MSVEEATRAIRAYLAADPRPTRIGERAKVACLAQALVRLSRDELAAALVAAGLFSAKSKNASVAPMELEGVLERRRKRALGKAWPVEPKE